MTLPITTPERIAALKRFGYDTEEARFICLTALHSGYFVRRQFLAFVRATKGSNDIAFLEKLRANQHSQVTRFRHNRMIYHLSAKPLYDAIGEKDNRNRRERQPSTIKNKLMGLDFVLENPEYQYLSTEREKLDYFVKTLGIKAERLPTRWYASPQGREATPKHFVEKYPLFLSCTSYGSSTPVVHFCYVDEGLQSTDGFATYLSHYSRLLTALSDSRVVYIAQDQRLLDSARRVFEAFSGQVSDASGGWRTTKRGRCWSILKRAGSTKRVILRASIQRLLSATASSGSASPGSITRRYLSSGERAATPQCTPFWRPVGRSKHVFWTAFQPMFWSMTMTCSGRLPAAAMVQAKVPVFKRSPESGREGWVCRHGGSQDRFHHRGPGGETGAGVRGLAVATPVFGGVCHHKPFRAPIVASGVATASSTCCKGGIHAAHR